MSTNYNLDPADSITVGTIGPPGQRIFHLQARCKDQLLTLIIEKEQAAALSASILSMLDELEEKLGVITPAPDLSGLDLELEEPLIAAFRVAQMGLGYDEEHDRMILIVTELQPEGAPEGPDTARMTASREQMRILAEHARRVVAKGRPDPRSNGHRHA